MRPLSRPSNPVRIACALLLAALTLAACGDDNGGGSASAPTAPAPTASTTTAAPATVFDNALWPDPAVATAQADPVEVARSFVEDFLGMTKPAFGAFLQGDSRSGEVQVHPRGEDGAVLKARALATIALRQLDGSRWFVIAAHSDQVEISQPRAAANEVMPTISSPVQIAGEAVGFEGTVIARVHEAFERKPLAEDHTIAGAMEREPFSIELEFERPRGATGAIVAHTTGGIPGTNPFSAIPVRFGAR